MFIIAETADQAAQGRLKRSSLVPVELLTDDRQEIRQMMAAAQWQVLGEDDKQAGHQSGLER